MNNATLEIRGLAELKDALGKLPAELKAEATSIVMDTSYAAATEIAAQYPLGASGDLKKGVKVKVQEIGPFAVAAQVRSTAPHAWWFEHGHELTKRRETKTHAGRGIMFSKKGIPRPVFIPTMIRHRRAMYQKLAGLLRATGLQVTLE